MGLFGVVLGTALLVGHLAGLESFGTAYLAPLAAGGGAQILRQPLPKDKLRPGYLNAENRRKQR